MTEVSGRQQSCSSWHCRRSQCSTGHSRWGLWEYFVIMKRKYYWSSSFILPAGSAGYLSGQDVPGLWGCIQCVRQGDGIRWGGSKLNVHFTGIKKFGILLKIKLTVVTSVGPADRGRIKSGLTSSYETGGCAFPITSAHCVASHGLEVKS